MIEWFALDLKGFFSLPADVVPGDYQFAFASDDGAILDLDGKTVLNHDGHHHTTWKCASQPVSLKAGDKLPMRIRYFQGPRVEIALQLFWRSWSQKSKPCDGSSKAQFEIVPAEAFSH
ncbi:MAG: hypothetical protein HC902_07985 [Calothrix sp. SM1_5_4]|nr:hypothetical protein [Calothrix sp. SM1_5_4]